MRPTELLARFHRAQRRAYQGGALNQLLPLLAADITWHVPGRNPIAGEYRGEEETLAYMRLRRKLARESMRISVRGEFESDDTVAVFAGGSITASGLDTAWETVGVYRFSGDRLAEAWLVPLDPEHFDGIWTALGAGVSPPRASEFAAALPAASLSRAGEMTTELLELGSVAVARHRVPAGFDSAPLYRDLPDGVCPCEHLCMLEIGELAYRFSDGNALTLAIGRPTWVRRGHLADVAADASLIELTALPDYRRKAEAIRAAA